MCPAPYGGRAISEIPHSAFGPSLAATAASPPRPLPVEAVPLALAAVAALLLLASAGQDLLLGLRPELLDHKVWLLDVDAEHNVYTWFSSALLLGAGLAMLGIAEQARLEQDRLFPHWLLLGVVFVGLSAEEVVGLHEKLSVALQQTAHTRGALYPAWVIPALAACAVGALAYLRFLAGLPARVRWLMLAAAGLYVGGAAGVEMLEGDWLERHQYDAPAYRALMTLEEGLEVAGVLVLLYALGLYRTVARASSMAS